MPYDPVCGMKVCSCTRHTYEYRGKKYYFCSEECLEEFKKDPSVYVIDESSGSTC